MILPLSSAIPMQIFPTANGTTSCLSITGFGGPGGKILIGSLPKLFLEASAQRLMQALGAYGFLGHKKRLKAFLEHIPAGLRTLQHVTSQVASIPRLRELSWHVSA